MVSFRAKIFASLAIIGTIVLYFTFSDSFAWGVASSGLRQFVLNPLQHQYMGAALLSIIMVMTAFLYQNRRAEIQYRALWALAIFALVIITISSQANATFWQNFHDLLWEAVNTGEYRFFLGMFGIPFTVLCYVMGASVWIAGVKTVVNVATRSGSSKGYPSNWKHKGRKQSATPVKLNTRKRKR